MRLNAIAASTSQAELAAKLPEGRWASGLEVGDDLLDDRVASVVGLGLHVVRLVGGCVSGWLPARWRSAIFAAQR